MIDNVSTNVKARSVSDRIWEHIKDAPNDAKWIPNCDVKILCLLVKMLNETVLEFTILADKNAQDAEKYRNSLDLG